MVRETVDNLQQQVRGCHKLRLSACPAGGRRTRFRSSRQVIRQGQFFALARSKKKSTKKKSSIALLNKGCEVSCSQRVDAAYHGSIADADVARALQLSRPVIRESRIVVAHAESIDAYDYVHTILDQLEAKGERVDTYSENELFDGSRQPVAVELDPLMDTQSQKGMWETIVIIRRLNFHTERSRYRCRLPCSPMPCIGSDAGNYWDALKEHPSSQKWVKLTTRIIKMSTNAFLLRGGDKGTGVLKAMAFEAGRLKHGEGHAFHPCFLHGGHKCTGFVIRVIGMAHLSAIYSFTILLSVGGYFMRVCLAVRCVVHSANNPLASKGSDYEMYLAEEFLKFTELPCQDI